MLVGACIGFGVGPARVYRTAAIFYAEPPPHVGHRVPGEYEACLRQRQEVHKLTFATLRSPDLPEIAIQQRGPHPESIIHNGAQLHDHLEFANVPDTPLLQIAVTDLSESGASQTLEAFVAAANQRINLTSSLKYNGIGSTRVRTPDHRRQIFAAGGAGIGALAMICFLLVNRRSNETASAPPLQPASSS